MNKEPKGGLTMTALALLLGVLALPLASCHTTPPSPPAEKPLPLPAGTESTVKIAEEIGRAIYEQDDLSAKATDAMRRENILQKEKCVQGWITIQREEGWLVRFVGKEGDEYIAYHDVSFPSGQPAQVLTLDPPQKLPKDQVEMVSARELAIQATMPRICSGPYNPVILPANVAHAEGLVVYLLAATRTPGEIMFGGHYRVELSTTGTEVKRVLPLSKTCAHLPPSNPPGSEVLAAMTTHIISDTPIETHVYLNLLHRKQIYVSTKLGNWSIEKGTIRFDGKR